MSSLISGMRFPCKRSHKCLWGTKTLLLIALLLPRISAAENPITNPLLGLTAAQIASAYDKPQEYIITRNGKRIGVHHLSFRTEDDTVVVSVDSSITVRILRIPVYRLSYVSEEVWRDNTLISVVATTTENGDSNTVEFDITTGGPSAADTHYASNHWHPGVLTGDTVFNTLTGESSNITVTDLGVEEVSVSGSKLNATHYRYDDDIQANVWYDTDGLWMKMKFSGEDGSLIQYLRR